MRCQGGGWGGVDIGNKYRFCATCLLPFLSRGHHPSRSDGSNDLPSDTRCSPTGSIHSFPRFTPPPPPTGAESSRGITKKTHKRCFSLAGRHEQVLASRGSIKKKAKKKPENVFCFFTGASSLRLWRMLKNPAAPDTMACRQKTGLEEENHSPTHTHTSAHADNKAFTPTS